MSQIPRCILQMLREKELRQREEDKVRREKDRKERELKETAAALQVAISEVFINYRVVLFGMCVSIQLFLCSAK